jgi:hypothetical protein
LPSLCGWRKVARAEAVSLTATFVRRFRPLGLIVFLLLALALPGRADAAQVSNERFTFALTVTNPCTGEAVFMEGAIHFLVTTTFDESGGGHFVVESNTQAMGISASGASYILIETGGFVETPASVIGNFTLLNTFRIVRQGGSGEDDFTATELMHGTVVDGEVVADVFRFETECR